jgi:hypothetical protein
MVTDFIHILASGDYQAAGLLLDADMTFRAQRKLEEMKKQVMAKIILEGEEKPTVLDRTKLDDFSKRLKDSQDKFEKKLHDEAEKGKKKADGSLEEMRNSSYSMYLAIKDKHSGPKRVPESERKYKEQQEKEKAEDQASKWGKAFAGDSQKKQRKAAADEHEKLRRSFAKEENSIEEDSLDEAGPTRIIRARIRNGKLQRRKKVATRPGYTIRGGKLVRMSPAERRKRKLGARKGKMKRRAKAAISNRKRAISLKKR